MRHEDKRKVAPFADPGCIKSEKTETPGEAYAREFLQGSEMQRFDDGIIASLINDGELVICPVCQFLRLPKAPFAPLPMLTPGDTAADVDCDICRVLPAWTQDVFGGCYGQQADMTTAPGELARLRLHRAELYFMLWMETGDAARALCGASMENALAGLRSAVKAREDEEKGADHADA